MSHEPLTLVVLAAGMGSRYGGLKQIDPVGPGGETLLDYSIFDAVRAGFERVVFVIRRDIEAAFTDSVGDKYAARGEVAVGYAFQELAALPEGFTVPPDRTKPWGTAHATLMAESVVDGPFAVLNADDFYGAGAFERVAGFLRQLEGDADSSANPARYVMAGFILRDTLSDHGPVVRGVCATEGGYLKKIVERRDIAREGAAANYRDADGERGSLSGDESVSMNFWGFSPSLFAQLRERMVGFLDRHRDDPNAEYLLPEAIDEMIAAGVASVRVLPCDGPWFGITHREDREAVARSIARLVAAGEYPDRLWD